MAREERRSGRDRDRQRGGNRRPAQGPGPQRRRGEASRTASRAAASGRSQTTGKRASGSAPAAHGRSSGRARPAAASQARGQERRSSGRRGAERGDGEAGWDQEDSRRSPSVRQQPHPLVFIIPGGLVLLVLAIVALNSGSRRSRPAQDHSTGSSPVVQRTAKELTPGEKVLAQGRSMLARAQAMPLSPQRNEAFHQARAVFERARGMLQQSGQQDKATEANQYSYACMKYATD